LELVESLCGFHRCITSLDNRELVIQTIPGEIIRDGTIKCIHNEGMPTYKNPFEKGKLLIQFVVDFPETINPAHIEQLEALLPAKPESIVPDDAEVCTLIPLDMEKIKHQRGMAYEEDDEAQYRGHPGVQCQSH